MKSSELRIGNLIYWSSYKGSFERTVVNAADLKHMVEEPEKDNHYSPIPLTEEWLLKFGFESQLIEIRKGDFYVKRIKKHFEYYCNNRVELKYVHQLQNLYHALTGEELNE